MLGLNPENGSRQPVGLSLLRRGNVDHDDVDVRLLVPAAAADRWCGPTRQPWRLSADSLPASSFWAPSQTIRRETTRWTFCWLR